MRKKLFSIALAGVLSVTAIAGSAITANASNLDVYTPGATVETNRFYFAMPGAWLNDETAKVGDAPGIYWWSATDSPDDQPEAAGHGWPGYKCAKADEEGVDNLYYSEVPTDVTTIVWSNYLDGGMDPTLPVFAAATQSKNYPAEFIGDGDTDTYDNVEGFWDYVNELGEEGDFSEFGDYADNFFYDGEYTDSYVFNFNNMVYVVNLDPETIEIDTTIVPEGKMNYIGEMFFYYGNGEYGTWPTKELNEAHKDDEGTISGNFTDDSYWKSTAVDPADVPNNNNNNSGNNGGNNNGGSNINNSGAEPTTTIPAPNNQNATSSASSDSASKTTTSSNNSNGSIATGELSLYAVAFVIVAAGLGVFYFTRKKYNK